MQKIYGALIRLDDETQGRFYSVRLFADASGHLVSPQDKSICHCRFDAGASPSEIAAAIDKYRESLKPKPRPIPEIVRDLKECYQKYRPICHHDIGKLLDELSNSPAATFPF